MQSQTKPPVDQLPFHVEQAASSGQVVPHVARAMPMAQPFDTRPTVPHFSIDDMLRIAHVIAKSGMFGSKDPNAVATLCMLAHAEGQHPAVVFRDYDIIKGRPSKKAEAMQRDFLAAGGKIEWHHLENTGAAATFSHPQAPSPVRIEWDIERATQAGLWGKTNSDGSKGMWQRYPRPMFRSRVVSEGVRTVWPLATNGLYSSEEAIDIAADEETAAQAREAEWRRNAEDFTETALADVEQANSIEALDNIKASYNREVRKLGRRHADLYTRIMGAYEAKERALQGYDPVTGELGETAEKEASVHENFERRLAECKSRAEVEVIDRDWCKVRAAQNEETVELIDDMIARKRRAFSGGK
jgi:hypothetical protein